MALTAQGAPGADPPVGGKQLVDDGRVTSRCPASACPRATTSRNAGSVPAARSAASPTTSTTGRRATPRCRPQWSVTCGRAWPPPVRPGSPRRPPPRPAPGPARLAAQQVQAGLPPGVQQRRVRSWVRCAMAVNRWDARWRLGRPAEFEQHAAVQVGGGRLEPGVMRAEAEQLLHPGQPPRRGVGRPRRQQRRNEGAGPRVAIGTGLGDGADASSGAPGWPCRSVGSPRRPAAGRAAGPGRRRGGWRDSSSSVLRPSSGMPKSAQ